MKTLVLAAGTLLAMLLSGANAFLDLEQEVLHIPDTHEAQDYVWNVRNNPGEFTVLLEQDEQAGAFAFSLGITSPGNESVQKVHLLVTDRKALTFEHLHPVLREPGRYDFSFAPPTTGTYRFETLIRTSVGWVRVSRDLKLQAPDARPGEPGDPDPGLQIRLNKIPKTAFAGHVTTFLFDVTHRGEPAIDLEPIDGHDLVVAAWNLSWFGSLDEFLYGTSRQDLGGPRAAASIVFTRAGRYVLFAQLKHRGKTRTVRVPVDVRLEPPPVREPVDFGD